jgi:hypothetical protein
MIVPYLDERAKYGRFSLCQRGEVNGKDKETAGNMKSNLRWNTKQDGDLVSHKFSDSVREFCIGFQPTILCIYFNATPSSDRRSKVIPYLTNQASLREDVWASGDKASSFLTSAIYGGERSASRLCRRLFPLIMAPHIQQDSSNGCYPYSNIAECDFCLRRPRTVVSVAPTS